MKAKISVLAYSEWSITLGAFIICLGWQKLGFVLIGIIVLVFGWFRS
jgi:hypothetical protein